MITLNLIPKQLKTEIETKKASISVIGMFVLSFIILGLTYELLYATKKLLTHSLESLESQNQAFEDYFDSEKNKEIEATIKEANILFINIDKIQKNKVLWSNILVELSAVTPDQVIISKFVLNREKNEVEIIGKAEARDQLLEYAEALNEFKYFKNVDLPSGYLISPSDILFEITANLNDQNLISKDQ
ncbi:MAG: PilN domain-containing protein [Parcubacteria group bacterium]|nr:PilN domain-containing protein [Parcubacteria group bacterium]